MPTLYTMPETCALAPNIAIAWLDAPIGVHTMPHGDNQKQDYLAINPQGKVPALKFDDGDVLTEASAILTFLGKEYGGEGTEEFKRNRTIGRKEEEALAYMASEVHSAYGPHFAPDRFADSENAQSEVKQKAYETLADHYAHLNKALTDNGGTWYLGQRSFADAYLYVLERWIEQTPLNIDDYPALKAHRDRMQADAGVQTALKRQDMKPV